MSLQFGLNQRRTLLYDGGGLVCGDTYRSDMRLSRPKIYIPTASATASGIDSSTEASPGGLFRSDSDENLTGNFKAI